MDLVYMFSMFSAWGVKVNESTEVFTDLNVWLGRENKVKVVANEDYYLTIPKRKKKKVKAVLEY